jgi:hypothetical protein
MASFLVFSQPAYNYYTHSLQKYRTYQTKSFLSAKFVVAHNWQALRIPKNLETYSIQNKKAEHYKVVDYPKIILEIQHNFHQNLNNGT